MMESSGTGTGTGGQAGWRARAAATLYSLWGVATDRRLPWRARLPALAGVAYVVSPIDLIPDWLPGVGTLDDALVLAAAAALTVRGVPAELLREHRARAASRRPATPAPTRSDGLDDGGELWPLYWAMIAIGVALVLLAAYAALGPGLEAG
jgi:uncharacterized membrane protein YkvA (DUF1232 family)